MILHRLAYALIGLVLIAALVASVWLVLMGLR